MAWVGRRLWRQVGRGSSNHAQPSCSKVKLMSCRRLGWLSWLVGPDADQESPEPTHHSLTVSLMQSQLAKAIEAKTPLQVSPCSSLQGLRPPLRLSLISLLYCAIYTTALSSSILHDCTANLRESNQFEPIMGKHSLPHVEDATARSITCTPDRSLSLAASQPLITSLPSVNHTTL